MNNTSRNRGERGGVLKVILIIVGVFFVLCLAGDIYVATHWKGWVANAANRGAETILRDSGLPEDQRKSIIADIRKLGDDFQAGRITTEQLGKITQAITTGPLLPLASVQAAKEKYIEHSDMTQKEKADAILSLQRFARGVVEKKISRDEVTDVVKPVSDLMPNGRWKLKDKPTRMEIDQFIENVKARADSLNIPEEPYDLNIADELKKAIEQG
jgi:hypothetical protein